MLIAGSAFKGYAIEATDGPMGTVRTFLFDDTTWKIRWAVVNTGTWLTDRLVLVHPSAIGVADHVRQVLPVALTKAQVEDGPDIRQDRPVSLQMQDELYGYYGWEPSWGMSVRDADMSSFGMSNPGLAEDPRLRSEMVQLRSDDGDPQLRSMAVVEGAHILATDGSIGHVENFLMDDAAWVIRTLVVDTGNWWPGAEVLISPDAVTSISWREHEVHLSISCADVKASPSWDPVAVINAMAGQHQHVHDEWPVRGASWWRPIL